jgi:glycosyltransferase involved in cell wall biosynthesis
MKAGTAGSVFLNVTVNARHLAGPRTGIEVYMEQLMGALARTGRVHLTAVTWEPLGFDLPGVTEVIPVRRPDFRPGSIPATLWKLWFDQWKCLTGIKRPPELLYHGMEGFLPYSLRRGDRAVVTVHDLGWQVYPELYNRRLRVMYSRLFPWAVRRADRFIAVSRYTADDLIRRAGIPAAKIDVVYHGVDPAFSENGNGQPQNSEQPYILAVGGVSPRKNTRRLVEAFSRWRASGGPRARFRLLITGTSLDPEFAGSMLPDGVSLLGYVNKEALPDLYRRAALFLYPGIYEGFGLPILESMACGTPVVTSETGAAPEIAGGAAVLVDPFSVDSILAGIDQACRPEESLRLRSLGRQRAGGFRWPSSAEATIQTYEKLQIALPASSQPANIQD